MHGRQVVGNAPVPGFMDFSRCETFPSQRQATQCWHVAMAVWQFSVSNIYVETAQRLDCVALVW